MGNERKIFKITAFAAAAAFSYPHGVFAADEASELREKTVSAEELLSADVFNVGSPVGNVRDLVLNEAGTAVEYVLYEVPYPYSLRGADNGFVAFDNIAVELQPGTFGSHVRFDDEASAQAPETLSIDRAEADDRLLSRILDNPIELAGDETRPVEDVLIDRETGEISGFVVNENPDSWFNEEPRLVPADKVRIESDGELTSTVELAALETIGQIE